MERIHSGVFVVLFGLILAHTVTGQAASPAGTGGGTATAPDPTGSPNIRTDVTDTVMALLNETGYSGNANDANVQEIVAMLMNGTVPTDADLIRLKIIPPPTQVTTPPPYSIPGTGLDPSISFGNGGLSLGPQTDPSGGGQPPASGGGFPTGGFPSSGFPAGGFPSTGGGAPPAGTGLGSASDALAGIMGNFGAPGSIPSFPMLTGNPTTPKPALADPFNMNTVTGGASQLPGLNAIDLNALGPKPFPNSGPVGGLGTPGSPTDLLGSLGPGAGVGGLGGSPSPPQTGILDSAMNSQNRRGGLFSNPMMMMFMMNPEMMEQMMTGENPMLTYMMMQQFMKKPQKPQPTIPSSGGLGGLTGLPGAGGLMSLPLPGGAPGMGGAGGGLMDIMSSLGGAGGAGLPAPGAGGAPIDLTALANMGLPGGPALPGGPGLPTGAAGGTPMDIIPGAGPSPTGPAPADITPFLNMINTGAAGAGAGVGPGAGPSAVPMTDPFVATAG